MMCRMVVWVLLLVGFAVPAHANLLQNPGFENGTEIDPDAWIRFDFAGRVWWAQRTGGFGCTLWGWHENVSGGFWQDVTGQTGETTYVLSVYSRAESNFDADSVHMKLEWFAGDVKIGESVRELIGQLTPAWKRHTYRATSPPETTMVRVMIGGTFYHPQPGATDQLACTFDDVSLIIATNTPAPPPEVETIGVDGGGHPIVAWSAESNRHHTVWRSTHPDVWRKTYSPSVNSDDQTLTWCDTEVATDDHMLYRVTRGEELTPGSTVSLTAKGTTGVTYSRFLPSSYTPEGTNPIVFAFSPIGEGVHMVYVFRSSAEKFGWVVVGCDTLENVFDPLHDFMFHEIYEDVRNGVPHDEDRVYLAGFSGGARRALRYGRSWWNEFAGVISLGGWIGDYDDYTFFPRRLAVARLNGNNDFPAVFRESIDRPYLEATGVRVHDIRFEGDHILAPPAIVDRALTWLNQDYASTGHTFVAADHVAAAPPTLEAAQDAYREGAYTAATTQALHLLHFYPSSWEAQQAEHLLLDVFGSSAPRSNVVVDPPAAEAAYRSSATMEMALLDTAGFGPGRNRALLELSYALNAGNYITCAQLASMLLDDAPVSARVLERAAQLARDATEIRPSYWYGWYVLARADAATANYREAVAHATIARDAIFHPNSGFEKSLCTDAIAEYESHL